MPIPFQQVYLKSAGLHLPGTPIDNDGMDAYIAPLNRTSGRIKQRILAENGIKQRYYAIDTQGNTTLSNAAMAARAATDCLANGKVALSQISLLASGSGGGDTLMPGFANMIQGELAAQPLETLSVHGICVAGVGAMQAVAQSIELDSGHSLGLAVASEMPSRLFKRSRFASRDYNIDFDSHFLRWMLSDGAGAVLLGRRDAPGNMFDGVQLRLRWIHQKSFAGDYPVCMQLGLSEDRTRSHLDYSSWGEAEADGALSVRQDIRLLPHLFDVGIHEYVQLVRQGWFEPEKIQHFLCHYSSEKFIPVIAELMEKAGLVIPQERWWSNLAWRGNTGAASILVMLAEFLQTKTLTPGEQILCFIPESGRFTSSYMLLEVEASDQPGVHVPAPTTAASTYADSLDAQAIAPPHDPDQAPQGLGPLLTELAAIWHDYRSRVWRTPMIRKLRERQLTVEDYVSWSGQWVPQVREGSKWMREAVASLSERYSPLAELITLHASEEQHDFKVLFEDYRKAGGTANSVDELRRNPGGEALNAYLHSMAATPDPIGLLGAIYIIEGTGQRIIPALLPLLKASLKLPHDAFRFLEYHGENDEHHLARWLNAVVIALDCDESGNAERAIIDTARRVAALYLMQFQHLGIASR